MPIARKILTLGKNSYGITLPKSWLQLYEKKHGNKIDTVAIEVNEALIIRPILPEKAPT